MRKLAWLLAAFVLLGFPAYAEDTPPELPPIDGPDQWHVLTHDDATSTSKCIGDPKTPLCAVETVKACFLREDDELCRIGMGNPNLPSGIKTEIQHDYTERYWVVGAEIVTPRNQKSLSFERSRPKVDDVVIKVIESSCIADKCSRPVGPPAIYYLRRTGNKWRVAGGGTPRW